MRVAWDIRRRAARYMKCRVGEVIMSECLKMAWTFVKEERPKKVTKDPIKVREEFMKRASKIKKPDKVVLGDTTSSETVVAGIGDLLTHFQNRKVAQLHQRGLVLDSNGYAVKEENNA